eukprot:scaffold43472_cov73-Skeletonema_marinoi.AAC.1
MPSAGKCSPEEKKTGIPSSSVSAASSWSSASIPSSERHHGKNDSKNNTNALSLNSLSSKHEGGKIRSSLQAATKKRQRDDDDKGSFSFDSDDNGAEGSLNLGNKIPSNNLWNNQENTSRKSGNNTATSLSLVHLRTASLVAPPFALPSNASRYPASPKATQHSAALPSASLGTSSLGPASLGKSPFARSHFELRRYKLRSGGDSTKRIEGQKSGRTPAAAAFDSNKEERMRISSSLITAHEVLHSVVGSYTSMSLVGPVVDPSWLQGEDEAEGAWNSMNTGQLWSERNHGHKRTPQFDQTSDNTYACFAGWIQRYNKKWGSKFSVFGISDEEIIAFAEKGVRCNICDCVLPESVGLKHNFIHKVNLQNDERESSHPLRYHNERCEAKCDLCGITVDDYVLAKGNDTGWTKHAYGCRIWHEQFNALIKVQKKHGKWRISKRKISGFTSEEKSAL